MKIRRFVAADMKTALAQIKEELGADAVIMSNKKIVEGVEIMAAVEYYPAPTQEETAQVPSAQAAEVATANRADNDVVSLSQNARMHATSYHPQSQSESQSQSMSASMAHCADTTSAQSNEHTAPVDSLSALLNRDVQQATEEAAYTPNATQPAEQSNSDIEVQFKNFTDRLQQTSQLSSQLSSQQALPQRHNDQSINNKANTANVEQTTADQAHVINPSVVQTNTNQTANAHQPQLPERSSELEHMKKEMHTIRHILENQMSDLMWQDMAQKNPQKALLINKLVALGLTDHMADQIAGFIPPTHNEQDAWAEAKKFIAQQLNTTNNDIIHHGGIISLVGPTGVGKTTTIAKLAARFAQIHGADEVVLISTDSFRIGGFEQLTTYGRIIGCQVKLAKDTQSLDALLQQFGQKKLILIDTAGMGQRDMRLAQHLTDLIANARVKIRNYLVLSANTQQRVMQENVERFKKIPLAGCIYTKLDESVSIGEIISTSIQNGLPIGYLTDGQRVPKDIKVANAEKLVALADSMSNQINHQHANAWRPMPNKQASAA